MKLISKTVNKIKWNKMKNRRENTVTFLVLLLKKWRRVQSIYGPNIRVLEN